jgi:Domain of unknown function (DUF4440)
MRLPLACALAAVLLFCACSVPIWRDTPVHSWSAATGAEQLERLFWEEIKARRWTELERHVSATFVAVTPNGRLDRAQAISYFRALQVTDYSLADCEVQPNGRDATVSCTASWRGGAPAQGPASSASARTMTIWQQGAHGWMAIAHSVVPLDPR